MKFILIDKNKELIDKAQEMLKTVDTNFEVTAVHSDIKKYLDKKDTIIATASNPSFTMGGGLDAILKNGLGIDETKLREGKVYNNKVLPIISVDAELKSTEQIILRALALLFYRDNDNNTYLFTGLGTSIGGLDIDSFIKVLKAVLTGDMSKYADVYFGESCEFGGSCEYGEC